MKNTRSRLAALEKTAVPKCDPVPRLVLDAGEPVPDDAWRCPACGDHHILRINEVVVMPDDGRELSMAEFRTERATAAAG